MRLFDNLVAEDANKIDGDTNVLHDETLVIECANKYLDAFREGEDDQKAESDVRPPRTARGTVWDVGGVDLLGLAGPTEEDMGD